MKIKRQPQIYASAVRPIKEKEMKQILIATKWFTIEIYRRGIVFSVASILFLSGVNLCNDNVVIALISIFNKQIFNKDSDSYGLFVGLFLILISLFLFYLLIINWRKEIYSEVFKVVRRSVDSFGTTWRVRLRCADADYLRPLHQKAQEQYEKALSFINENQTLIDNDTYSLAWHLLNVIAEEILQLDIYIARLTETSFSDGFHFDPNKANRETVEEIDKINSLNKEFVSHIREKEKYKFKY